MNFLLTLTLFVLLQEVSFIVIGIIVYINYGGPNQFLRILNNIQLIANTWYDTTYDIKDSDIVLQKSIIPLESFYISRELISEICKCSVNSKEIQETLDKYVKG